MKRFILVVLVAVCATPLFAGMDKVIAKVQTASMTAAVSTVSTTSRITGYLKRLDFTFDNTTSVVDSVVLTSSNVLSKIVTTHKTLTTVATNASYMLQTNILYSTCLFDEPFYLTVTNTTVTNQNVQAVIFYERP